VRPRPSPASLAFGLGALALAVVLVLDAVRTYSVRPLREWDGWVIWGTKARALYEHDGVRDAVFASEAYEHPDYPLLLPTLEAMALRALGEFDGTKLHLQLGALALAFVLAAWTITRASASPAVCGLAVLAAVSAPAVLIQLGWNYADVPLALLCALGVAALAAWLRTQETWLLTSAAIFLAAAASTKSEGLPYALAAFAAALAVTAASRGRIRPLLVAGGAFVLAILPWRLYVLVHDLHPQDYELSNLLDPSYLADASGRVRPAAAELVEELVTRSNWSYLLLLAGCALVTALLRGRYAEASFSVLWAVASFGALVLGYWINELPLGVDLFSTSYRTIATLLVGGALLAAPLVGWVGSPASAADEH
jgi:hypothetical protein